MPLSTPVKIVQNSLSPQILLSSPLCLSLSLPKLERLITIADSRHFVVADKTNGLYYAQGEHKDLTNLNNNNDYTKNTKYILSR
jgi:hypothetical protein